MKYATVKSRTLVREKMMKIKNLLLMFTMALGFPNSILADDDLRPHGFIRAEVHEHQLLVRTEPNAIVVITREPSDGYHFKRTSMAF